MLPEVYLEELIKQLTPAKTTENNQTSESNQTSETNQTK